MICKKCDDDISNCFCKEYVDLVHFHEQTNICPECFKTYPKFRLPLLTVCVDCPNEETRANN